MEFLQLKQKWATDAGLSLAPPSSFATPNNRYPSYTGSTAGGLSRKESSPDCSSSIDEDCGFIKKRKRDGGGGYDYQRKGDNGNFLAGLMRDVELHQQSPLPPGWEQCLDLQSGEMYYFNSGMRIKTRQDPRKGFNGPIPNDWNPARFDSSYKENLFRRNSYSEQLQKMERSAAGTKRVLCKLSDPENAAAESRKVSLELDLSLKLSSSPERHESLNSRKPGTTGIIPQWMRSGRQESSNYEIGDDTSDGVISSSSKKDAGMVAVACRQCLMFVMLPKASLKCPNCGAVCGSAGHRVLSRLFKD